MTYGNMRSQPFIEVDKVTKKYPFGGAFVMALDRVSFNIKLGDFVALTGPSGSGKTSLLNIIGGLDKPSSGRVIIDGRNISALDEDELRKYRLDSVGFIFQFYNLLGVLTTYENIELPLVAKEIDSRIREERVKSLMSLLRIENRSHHLPSELSGGEQQRVAIARALANSPLIVLADEPTGNLDSETGIYAVRLMHEAVLHENGTLIVATHDPEVAAIADYEIKLRNGRIVSVD